jgi:cell division septum initiation protein DivIVA
LIGVRKADTAAFLAREDEDMTTKLRREAAKLTTQDLQRAKACRSQIDLFREHFGEGGTVTLVKVRKVAHLFNWDWAARRLLSHSASAEYERVTASAQAEYDRLSAPAWAEYDRVRASALAEYDRVTASAWFAGWKADHAKIKA